MSFLGGIGDFFEDVVGTVVDVVDDVVDGVVTTVEGAVKGDPFAIASLAMMAYGAWSIYSAMSTGLTTATTTEVAKQSLTESVGSQVGSQAVQKGVESGLTQLTLETGKQVTVEELGKQIAIEAVQDQAKKMTLSEILKEGAISVGKNVAMTAATAAFAKPELSVPSPTQRAVREIFDTSPTVQTGTERVPTSGGISQRTSKSFENVGTLGRITEQRLQTLRI